MSLNEVNETIEALQSAIMSLEYYRATIDQDEDGSPYFEAALETTVKVSDDLKKADEILSARWFR